MELLHLSDEYADCFSDKSVLFDVVTHHIVTTPDFGSKPMRPRRVPEVFRLKVNRKVRELLDPGLIRLSDSSIANPVVRNTTEITVNIMLRMPNFVRDSDQIPPVSVIVVCYYIDYYVSDYLSRNV